LRSLLKCCYQSFNARTAKQQNRANRGYFSGGDGLLENKVFVLSFIISA